MKILLDTNILTRMAEPGHVQHQVALNATDLLGKQGHDLVLAPQNLYEFWVVCTRPLSLNGLGRNADEAAVELAKFRSLFMILDESPLVLPEWEKLVTSLKIVGKNAHDCRLVAAMTIHQVTHLLTFNDQDFRRFTSITVLTPDAVVAATPP
jgi:predicted nucleic acid-binding protein